MQNNLHNLGKQGEEIAKTHLINTGYTILETNWRYKKYEIDIIAQKANTLAIVEVKARTGNAYGEPEDFVTKKKQQFLVTAAHNYLVKTNNIADCRFDIVSILIQNNTQTIKHIEGAFYPNVK